MVTGTPDALPFIIGHRGASRDAPENTLESFRLAWEQGANGIEADFRLTADGHIVCIHDATARRTTGVDLVIADSTFEELRRLDAGSWKGSAWSGVLIPSLPEVLAEIPDDSWFFIEIKCGAEIISRLAEVLRKSGISPQRVRLLAFNAQLVKELKQRLPEWRTCWNCDYRHSMFSNVWHPSKEEIIATLSDSGADGLSSADRAILDTELVGTIKGLNKEIHVWTVDRSHSALKLSALGVDSIMTNRPAWLRRQLMPACPKGRVRILAWLPEMLIRHRVAEVLQRQADEQFEADYLQFHHSVESKERSAGAPFLLKGSSRRLGIVLMHGFLASPLEVLELANYLHGKGFWVYCVRLRGHGTSPEDLASRNGADWIESVDLGYALMNSICKQVVVGGFSLGGGLALNAAARLSDLAGVFAVSPPFRLLSLPSRLASAVTTWNRAMNTIHWHGATKEYVDNSSERPLINYQRIPISALAEMEHFMRNLEPRLPEVKIPALIVQGDHDPLVDSEGTAHIFDRIGSESKKYLPLDFSRHGIVSGEGSEHVHAEIAAFIAKI